MGEVAHLRCSWCEDVGMLGVIDFPGAHATGFVTNAALRREAECGFSRD